MDFGAVYRKRFSIRATELHCRILWLTKMTFSGATSYLILDNREIRLPLALRVKILASNTARVHFTLAGYHFNPDQVTQHLGIQPTSVDASGAKSDLSKPVLSSWELSTETVTGDFDVYKLTDELIKKIEPAKDKIRAICKSHNLSPRLGLVLSVDPSESVPEVAVGARTIRFLADIGAFINVDYQLSKHM